MKDKRVAILGAGISGLATAYFMQKHHPDVECVVFEKGSRIGGVIQSSRKDGIFFEHGPRTFGTNRTPNLLKLIHEVGLSEDLHFSSARNRYVLNKGKVSRIPDNVLKLLFSPFGKGVLSALVKDFKHPPGLVPDESIESFILRHGNRKVLEQIIDPIVTGIFAGDSSKLSVGACFPSWKRLEYKYGSIVKGLFYTKNTSTLPPLYTLKVGMHSLPEKIRQLISYEFRFETPVMAVEEESDHVLINGERFDHAMICLPANVLRTVAPEKYRPFFKEVDTVTLSAVNVAFENAEIPKDGFGYLAPKKEKSDIFGVVFDSSVFPELFTKDCVRVTVMLPGKDALEERSIKALQEHMGIYETPIQVMEHCYEEYLPQLLVGHLARRDQLVSKNLSFVGNYLYGVSVESCVTEAEHAAIHFHKDRVAH